MIDEPLTEFSLASAFAERYAGQLVYVIRSRKWQFHDGESWQWDRTNYVLSLAQEFIREVAKSARHDLKTLYWLGSAARVNGVMRLVKWDQRFAMSLPAYPEAA